MTATQENAVVAGAELILELARDAGQKCGITKEVAALRILDVAYAMAVCEAIGPGAPLDRVRSAILTLREKIETHVFDQYVSRYGAHV